MTTKTETQTQTREAVGLTQTEAARRARVSLATWRRWETDPTSVSATTATKCRKALLPLLSPARPSRTAAKATGETAPSQPAKDNAWKAPFTQAWSDSPILTPRQAYAIAAQLNYWAEAYIGEWDGNEPLHTLAPFGYLDLRVMLLVGENRAFAALAKERCLAVAKDIERGILPFDRPGCYFDEVLMGIAVNYVPDDFDDKAEGAFDGIPARSERKVKVQYGTLDYATGKFESLGEEWAHGDDDWEAVMAAFDDEAQWDDWEVPVLIGHRLLPAILETRHPFTWFDDNPRRRPTMRDLHAEYVGMTDPEYADALGAAMRPMAEAAGLVQPATDPATNGHAKKDK